MYQQEYLDCSLAKEIISSFAGWFTLVLVFIGQYPMFYWDCFGLAS